MKFLLYIFAAGVAYFLGSFSMSIFLSKTVLGGDVRNEGSGNAGATNMARVFGIGFGILTLLCDSLKAVCAILLGHWLLGEWGIFVGGFFCLLGHCYPVLHQFRGGKGVSVGAAIALAVDWRVFVGVVVAFGLGAVLSRKVSVGSVCASLSITVFALIFGVSEPRLLLAVLGMLLVIFRHRENIVRIIAGTEPDFKAARLRKRRTGTESREG